MRTIYGESGPKNRPVDQPKARIHHAARPKWYSTEYLASIWAKRPAKLLALIAFVAIAAILIAVFAAGAENTIFGSTDFSGASKTSTHVDGNGHVVLDTALTGGKVHWGVATVQNLATAYDTPAYYSALVTKLGREFAAVRKNYGPDNNPIISPELTYAYNRGWTWQYQNGKPNPLPPDGQFTTFKSIGNGVYDKVFATYFDTIKNAKINGAPMWTNANPLHYSFWHEQSVLSEDGGHFACTGGQATCPGDYRAAHIHVWNLMNNGWTDSSGVKHGPWHTSKGGNMQLAFVPASQQFIQDPTYGKKYGGGNPSGNIVGFTFTDLNPGAQYYDYLGEDMYADNNSGKKTALQMFGALHDAAAAMGKPMMTGETGIDQGFYGDAGEVTFLKDLDGLLKNWGGGMGPGQTIALLWTSRVAGASGDNRMDASAAVLAQFKSMGLDPFYGARVP